MALHVYIYMLSTLHCRLNIDLIYHIVIGYIQVQTKLIPVYTLTGCTLLRIYLEYPTNLGTHHTGHLHLGPPHIIHALTVND